MCCDQLVCANCAQPVALARCPVCRQSRLELHGAPASAPAMWLMLAVLAALTVAAALYARLA